MQALALILGSGQTALAECLALRAGYLERFLPQAVPRRRCAACDRRKFRFCSASSIRP